jgi:hypothetical protein
MDAIHQSITSDTVPLPNGNKIKGCSVKLIYDTQSVSLTTDTESNLIREDAFSVSHFVPHGSYDEVNRITSLHDVVKQSEKDIQFNETDVLTYFSDVCKGKYVIGVFGSQAVGKTAMCRKVFNCNRRMPFKYNRLTAGLLSIYTPFNDRNQCIINFPSYVKASGEKNVNLIGIEFVNLAIMIVEAKQITNRMYCDPESDFQEIMRKLADKNIPVLVCVNRVDQMLSPFANHMYLVDCKQLNISTYGPQFDSALTCLAARKDCYGQDLMPKKQSDYLDELHDEGYIWYAEDIAKWVSHSTELSPISEA